MPKIRTAEATETGLAVSFEETDGTAHYPWFWLRDHGEEPASLNPATLQREVDTASLPFDIHARAVCLEDRRDCGHLSRDIAILSQGRP